VRRRGAAHVAFLTIGHLQPKKDVEINEELREEERAFAVDQAKIEALLSSDGGMSEIGLFSARKPHSAIAAKGIQCLGGRGAAR
jgi:hypothetical protein